MARKPGCMYHNIKQHAYTRREYMGGVTLSRITQFVLGNKTGKFPFQILLCSNENCQIRHTALEAARVAANRYLEKKVGLSDYRLSIYPYPHNVLRENKQATGAGADRVSQGMRKSFGKSVGTAARVKKGQIIMKVETSERNFEFIRTALLKASSKLPPPCKIKIAS